ncbi:MAG: hypothetical protein LC640_03335 [Frankia sp.]|nr:hypothetical protein [Frankia sp.]
MLDDAVDHPGAQDIKGERAARRRAQAVVDAQRRDLAPGPVADLGIEVGVLGRGELALEVREQRRPAHGGLRSQRGCGDRPASIAACARRH